MAAAIPALGPGKTWIDMTSAAPRQGRELMDRVEQHGAECLEATLGGGVVTVYNSAGLTNDIVTVSLPAGGWSRVGGAVSLAQRPTGDRPCPPAHTTSPSRPSTAPRCR